VGAWSREFNRATAVGCALALRAGLGAGLLEELHMQEEVPAEWQQEGGLD
jgi:hypothetical protein